MRKYFFLPKYLFLLSRLFLLLFFYSCLRGFFYLYNIELFENISYTELTQIFYGGIRFDLVGIFYINIIYFVAFLLPFRFTYQKQYQSLLNWFYIVVNLIGFIANLFDTVYFQFTLKRTTGTFFQIFKNETGLIQVFLDGVLEFWHVSFIFLVLSIVLILFSKSVKIKDSSLTPFHFYGIQTTLFLLSIYIMISVIRGGFGRYTRPIAINNSGQYVSQPQNMALVLNTPFTILRTLRQKKLSLRNDFKNQGHLEMVFNPVQRIMPNGPFTKKNIIILIVESLSREHSGKLNPNLEDGKYAGYTPFLDSLMEHSLVFSNAYANGRKSIDALPSVITGIPAINTHYVISHYSTNKLIGLGNILNQNGYDLSFSHGAPNGSMGFNSFMNIAGFKKYFGKDEFNNNSFYDGTWGIWDEEFLLFMSDKIDSMPEPFCSVIFTLSSHHPFDVPDKYEGKFRSGPKNILKTVQYADFALKQFIKSASAKEWYENTLFVITADHGSPSYHTEYKNSIGAHAVPIIFFTPDGSLKGTDNKEAQQLDIFPTIIDYLNIETPFLSFGKSLLDTTNQRLAFFKTRGSNWLLKEGVAMEWIKNRPRAFYNYKIDPLLKRNLIDFQEQDSMAQLLKAILQQYNNRMINNELTVYP